jgi:hypothetical protein
MSEQHNSNKESIEISLLKADLQLKSSLNAIRDSPKYKHIREAMDKLPANKMIAAINYIDSNFLPAIKKKSGDKSADYLFFVNLIEMLHHSLVIYDRMKMLQTMHANARLDLELLRERVLLYESELNKYSTLEDVWLSEAMESIEKGIRGRMMDRINAKKG